MHAHRKRSPYDVYPCASCTTPRRCNLDGVCLTDERAPARIPTNRDDYREAQRAAHVRHWLEYERFRGQIDRVTRA